MNSDLKWYERPVRAGIELPVKRVDVGVEFVLPELGLYELVVDLYEGT